MNKQKSLIFDDLWRWFDYESRLQETTNQILRIADKPVDEEKLKEKIDIIKILSDVHDMKKLSFENNIREWEKDLFVQQAAFDTSSKIFRYLNVDKIVTVRLILATFVYNVLNDYKRYITDYFKNKL